MPIPATARNRTRTTKPVRGRNSRHPAHDRLQTQPPADAGIGESRCIRTVTGSRGHEVTGSRGRGVGHSGIIVPEQTDRRKQDSCNGLSLSRKSSCGGSNGGCRSPQRRRNVSERRNPSVAATVDNPANDKWQTQPPADAGIGEFRCIRTVAGPRGRGVGHSGIIVPEQTDRRTQDSCNDLSLSRKSSCGGRNGECRSPQ